MKRPKKPTLAQLKKRPAWWIDRWGDIAITYPNGSTDMLCVRLDTKQFQWRRIYGPGKERYLTIFGGWIENG